jgi:peptide/nickel transport system substrate-binding protein
MTNVGRLLALVASVCILASACASEYTGPGDSAANPDIHSISVDRTNENPDPPRDGGSLAFGLSAETSGWNPVSDRWSGSGYIVGVAVYDPLTAEDEHLEPHPYLARTITPNADFTEWRIGLRPGVRFHDGTVLDAKAVKVNLDLQKKSALVAAALTYMSEVTVADPLTVVVKMAHPWSQFPHLLTSQVGMMASPASLATLASGSTEATGHPVGTGPFVFGQWTRDSELQVTKNPNYWRKGFPHLDSITFKPITEEATRSKALEAGEINIMEAGNADVINNYAQRAKEPDQPFQIYTNQKTDGSKIVIGLNTAAEPFNDLTARQAVAYGIDREALSRTAFGSLSPPVDGPFTDQSPFYSPNIGYPHYDLERAKKLAQDYQQKHGKPLEFEYILPPVTDADNVGQVIQAQLQQAGITVNLKRQEQVALIGSALGGHYQAIAWVMFTSGVLDPNYVFIASDANPVDQLSVNFTRINKADNAKLVAALDAGRATTNPAALVRQYEIVQQELAKNLNILFLVSQTTSVVYDRSVRGAKAFTIPDQNGAPGIAALPKAQPFTFNMWRTT